MIARYTRPELAALWSESRRLALFLEVELAATAALEAAPSSPIPPGTAARLRQLAAQVGPLDPSRVAEIERRIQHELLAFLEHVEERLGPEARWLHFGLTSSDVLDTVLALQLREATQIIIRGIDEQLLPALRRQATAHQQTPMIGRTHGIFAEPIAAGLIFLGSYAEIDRAKARVQRAQKAIAVGKLSGAVGIYGSGSVTPEVEEVALSSLGLTAETVATQIVARDRHAELLWSLASLGAAIERLAVNLRHLQRSEVREVEEAFAPGQKGSSAMPHKKNPISAENLCGLARLLRASASAAIENIALWHERDISHSSVERVIMPDSTTLCDYMVQRGGATGQWAQCADRADAPEPVRKWRPVCVGKGDAAAGAGRDVSSERLRAGAASCAGLCRRSGSFVAVIFGPTGGRSAGGRATVRRGALGVL
jgi:adenylosuccinate lyase